MCLLQSTRPRSALSIQAKSIRHKPIVTTIPVNPPIPKLIPISLSRMQSSNYIIMRYRSNLAALIVVSRLALNVSLIYRIVYISLHRRLNFRKLAVCKLSKPLTVSHIAPSCFAHSFSAFCATNGAQFCHLIVWFTRFNGLSKSQLSQTHFFLYLALGHSRHIACPASDLLTP